MSSLMADARAFVGDAFKIDGSDLPEDSVIACIEQIYLGGWEAYKERFAAFHKALSGSVKTEDMTPTKRRSRIMYWTDYRLREHDEVLDFNETDLVVTVTLSIATVKEDKRRDKITARTVRIYLFTRPDTGAQWKRQPIIEFEEAVSEVFARYGRISDAEWVASQREQAQTCYRPGTPSTPLDGPARHAEVTHKEWFANETFQKPSKS